MKRWMDCIKSWWSTTTQADKIAAGIVAFIGFWATVWVIAIALRG